MDSFRAFDLQLASSRSGTETWLRKSRSVGAFLSIHRATYKPIWQSSLLWQVEESFSFFAIWREGTTCAVRFVILSSATSSAADLAALRPHGYGLLQGWLFKLTSWLWILLRMCILKRIRNRESLSLTIHDWLSKYALLWAGACCDETISASTSNPAARASMRDLSDRAKKGARLRDEPGSRGEMRGSFQPIALSSDRPSALSGPVLHAAAHQRQRLAVARPESGPLFRSSPVHGCDGATSHSITPHVARDWLSPRPPLRSVSRLAGAS